MVMLYRGFSIVMFRGLTYDLIYISVVAVVACTRIEERSDTRVYL